MTDLIPFFDYPHVFDADEAELADTITSVCRRGAFILQDELSRFEQELADFCGVAHAIGVGNGTDALILALRAAGIGPGDEVIMPSHTFVATPSAAHFVGATPVLVECGPDHLVDAAAVQAAITPATAAIMPVHLNGRTADMAAIGAIADQEGLTIVEDAAQAIGSTLDGRQAGSFGVAGTFSFYPAKTLGCFGDGGAVITDDGEVAEALLALRDHGRGQSGEVEGWGLNSRLDNLHAAVLSVKLAKLPASIAHRRTLATRYHDGLAWVEGLIRPPAPESDARHFDAYQNYEIEADDRNGLRHHLADNGIGSLLPWGGRAVHQMPGLGLSAELPFTDAVFERCLLLPMNTSVRLADVDRVCDVVAHFYARRGVAVPA